MRGICCGLACLFAFTAISTHHTAHVTYRTPPPAHHTTTEQP